MASSTASAELGPLRLPGLGRGPTIHPCGAFARRWPVTRGRPPAGRRHRWFTQLIDPGRIGRITPGQVAVTEFVGGVTSAFTVNREPLGITAGPRTAQIWFAEQANPGGVGRLTAGVGEP